MAGIAGITKPSEIQKLNRMLETIAYRGKAPLKIIESGGITFGTITSGRNHETLSDVDFKNGIADRAGEGHFAEALINNGMLELKRDELGVAPLYYDMDDDGIIYFASEVKALLAINRKVRELLPGSKLVGDKTETFYSLKKPEPLSQPPEEIAIELRKRMEQAVLKRITGNHIGAWLSGGLDSSSIAAIARQHIQPFHTFVIGLKGAKDVEFAADVASYIGSKHHEVVISFDDLLKALPKVIYHLESFDALLVRSSITNYLLTEFASDYVSEVFSGEGGDEFFAGYAYLKSMPLELLDDELIRISNKLHNTALQRVDRSASAFGVTPHVIFADPLVFEYALQIPIQYKMNNGIEKWILREAMKDALPEPVLKRTKSKFWEGTGIGELLAEYANKHITDSDFTKESILHNGWKLNSKEELMYYRIFKANFGIIENLDWMGRS